MNIGDIYPSNLWGDMIVRKYKNSRQVTIEFLESGYKYTAQKNNIMQGQIRDARRQADEVKVKELAKKLTKRVFLYTVKALSSFDKMHKKQLSFLKSETIREEKLEHLWNVLSKIYTHKEYGEYRVIDKISSNRYKIRFLESGNEYTHTLPHLQSKRVTDISRYSQEELKRRQSQYAATNYLQNREHRLEHAKAYQKANPEKARLNNHRRRAKRCNADGSYTKAEVDLIFENQNGLCTSCKKQLTPENKHLDHIMPIALGGSNYANNLQWLCQYCNNSKSAKHPDEWAAYIQTPMFKKRLEIMRNPL
jgi:5-methylcytosine-specific restriction endonuclease McrA